jgi:hypothetical protein
MKELARYIPDLCLTGVVISLICTNHFDYLVWAILIAIVLL